MPRYLAKILLAVLAFGCTKTEAVDAPTQVMLRISSRDAQLLEEYESLQLSVSLREGDGWKPPVLRSFPREKLKWPVDIPITPRVRADAYKQFEVVVEARKGGATLAQARVISGFLPDQRRLLQLELFGCPGRLGLVCAEAACVGDECEVCKLDGTCGTVVSVDPNDLAPWADEGDSAEHCPEGFALLEGICRACVASNRSSDSDCSAAGNGSDAAGSGSDASRGTDASQASADAGLDADRQDAQVHSDSRTSDSLPGAADSSARLDAEVSDEGGSTPDGSLEAGSLACVGDTWDHDQDQATACTLRRTCMLGEHVLSDGSATSDRTCTSCASGTFSSQANAATCSPWKICIWQTSDGSSMRDRTCLEQWVRQFGVVGTDTGRAIAIDSKGATYIAGMTSRLPGQQGAGSMDAYLRKYDGSGTELWTRQIGSADLDGALGVAIGPQDSVVVAGSIDNSGVLEGQISSGAGDCFVRKYDADGNVLWTHQFGTDRFDAARAVAVDRVGNTYVVGQTSGAFPGFSVSPDYDAFLRKYDAAGNHVWTQQFGSMYLDVPYGVAIDAQGDIYVAGETNSTFPGETSLGGWDGFLRKFDANGSVLWTRHVGTAQNDSLRAVSVDPTGNVVVAGETMGAFAGATNAGQKDAFVIKYDRTGSVLWNLQFGAEGNDAAYGISAETTFGIYITGFVSSSLWGPNLGLTDIFVRILTHDGKDIRSRQFGTVNEDIGYAVQADANGFAHVTGVVTAGLPGQGPANGEDAFAVKF